MKTALLVTLLGISTAVLAVEPNLSSEVDAAFMRLSGAPNYSFRLSTRIGEEKGKEYFSGRISAEKGAVWGMVDVIKGGAPTVTIVTKDGRGVLKVENQWMTLGDLFTEAGVPKKLKLPRQGMRTVKNVLMGPPRPSTDGLNYARLVETFAREGDRYVGTISKEQAPDGMKGSTFWVEVVNGIAIKWGGIHRSAKPGPAGGAPTGDWVLEISDVGTTRLAVPKGARVRLDRSEGGRPEPDGAEQPATAPESRSKGNENPKPESEAPPH